MTELQIKVCIAFAANDMNVSRAAAEMYIHRNTFVYHLTAIRKSTGLNPQRFYDLVALLEKIQSGELASRGVDGRSRTR